MSIFWSQSVNCGFFHFFSQTLAKLQPYYDDDRDPILDTDELDSEEDIILVGNTKKLEYHD